MNGKLKSLRLHVIDGTDQPALLEDHVTFFKVDYEFKFKGGVGLPVLEEGDGNGSHVVGDVVGDVEVSF
jgi:hypothetical protein